MWNGVPIVISPPYRLLQDERWLLTGEFETLHVRVPIPKGGERRDVRVIVVEMPIKGE